MKTTLKALAALLTYPTAELRSALQPIVSALGAEKAVGPAHRRALAELAGHLENGDPYELEEAYVALFDRGRATSLNLFEHLHGDSRDRGMAMVDLKRMYERAGFRLTARQLPDYLPVVLEYLSTRPEAEVREVLADCAHLVRGIGEALRRQRSPYDAVPAAILDLAGEAGLGAGRTVPPPEEKSLDEEWRDAEVVFGPAAACGGKSPDASVVRFMPRQP